MNSYVVTAAICCLAIGASVSSLPTAQHIFRHPVHFAYRTVHTPSTLSHPFTFFSNPNPFAARHFQPSHVPVVVPVAQDFAGNSVVVTREELPKLGLTDAVIESNVEPSQMVTSPEGNEVVAVVEEAASAGALSAVDDSFSLTALPKAEETVPENVIDQQATPVAPEPVVAQPPAPISPFETETYKAYDDFINTWLRLASVNLNRPDLLNLVSNRQQQQQTLLAETQLSVTPEVQQAEVLPEQPQVAEVVPEQPIEISPEVAIKREANTAAEVEASVPLESTTETILEESTPIAEVAPKDTNPIAQPEIIQEPVVVLEQLPETSVPQLTDQAVFEIQHNPFAVPRVTSRGRPSGFRYTFSHVPQSGASFFNSIAG